MYVTIITRFAQNCTMGASLYLCGPTMHVAKTMWSFLDNFVSGLFVSHGCLKKKHKYRKRLFDQNYAHKGRSTTRIER